MCVRAQSLSHVQFFAAPWTVCSPVSSVNGIFQQEYWRGLPFPPSGDLPDPGTEPAPPALQVDSLQLSHLGTQPLVPGNMVLFGNKFFCRCNQVEMRSYWTKVGPWFNVTGVLIRRGKDRQRREWHIKTHTHTHTHKGRRSYGGGDRDGSDAAASPETPRTAGSHQI